MVYIPGIAGKGIRMINHIHVDFVAGNAWRKPIEIPIKDHQEDQSEQKRWQRPTDNRNDTRTMIDPGVTMHPGQGAEPDSGNDTISGAEKITNSRETGR